MGFCAASIGGGAGWLMAGIVKYRLCRSMVKINPLRTKAVKAIFLFLSVWNNFSGFRVWWRLDFG